MTCRHGPGFHFNERPEGWRSGHLFFPGRENSHHTLSLCLSYFPLPCTKSSGSLLNSLLFYLSWKMKASKQPAPAFSLPLDSCGCLHQHDLKLQQGLAPLSSWFAPSAAMVPLTQTREKMVITLNLQIHADSILWYSRNFLSFFPSPAGFAQHLSIHFVPPQVPLYLTSCSQIHGFIESMLNLTAPCEMGRDEWVLLSLSGASEGICFPLTQHINFFFQEVFLDHLSQSLAFLWTHRIYFLASTFYNSSHFASWHFLYYSHELLLMSHICMPLSPQLNFKFLEGVYTSGYSSYCLDFNNFALWFKLWLDSKIHFIECPKQED